MPTNPFTGLISGLSELHRQAITALITSEDCTVPCQLVYGSTGFTDCPNCLLAPGGTRSANIYQTGGPVPFTNGTICPYCQGRGKVQTAPATENIELVVIWNPKDWIDVEGLASLHTGQGQIQTISVLSDTLPKLKRATSLIIGTDIENFERHKYQRNCEPYPCGFGANNFVVVMWKKYD